jgi:hypothetical protein
MRAALTKDRDMARSILPSKNRRAARIAKARIKRTHRSKVRQALRGAQDLVDLDEWDLDGDLTTDPSGEIRDEVRWRRRGDKLNHFERRAVRVTRDLRPQDRLPSMAARLPRGLVGDHALSHLRRRPELNPSYPYSQWRAGALRRRAEARRAVLREQRQLERVVRLMLETPGGHKALNATMKRIAQDQDPAQPSPPHLLRDVHGVPAFVAGLYCPLPTGRYRPAATPRIEDRRRAAVRALADAVDPAWRDRPP